jgi:RNA polymerase sigma-70 factor (ECF subfamily)
MGTSVTDAENRSNELVGRALAGDDPALAELFDRERPRLRRMVRLRLDPRLAARLDVEDVLQDAYLDVRRRLSDFRDQYASTMPIGLWFRLVTSQRLVDLHRHHLGAAARDASLEVSLLRGGYPQASSASLAAQLLGKLTSASRAMIRAEQRLMVQEALNDLDPIDREVLVLRHFEQLTNDEAALMLGLKKTAASQRYARALIRLKRSLARIPGLNPEL